MEVIIDGVKYVPQDCNKVTIGGIEYDNVAHWLTNIHAELLQKWVDKVKVGEPAPPLDDINEFECFVEKYLGFDTPKDGHGFVEKDSPVLSNFSNTGKVEQKPAWSEEDQEIWEEISDLLWEGFKKTYTKFSWDEIKGWIKPKIESFKVRAQSQSCWKPTDEQMEYLAKAIATLGDEGNCKTASILNDLRVELKKLRE